MKQSLVFNRSRVCVCEGVEEGDWNLLFMVKLIPSTHQLIVFCVDEPCLITQERYHILALHELRVVLIRTVPS